MYRWVSLKEMASSTVSSGKRKSFYTDLDHLKECFDKVDTEESGFIGCNELAQLVASMPNSGDSIVSELMEKLDRDRDGKVSVIKRPLYTSLFLLTDSVSKYYF